PAFAQLGGHAILRDGSTRQVAGHRTFLQPPITGPQTAWGKYRRRFGVRYEVFGQLRSRTDGRSAPGALVAPACDGGGHEDHDGDDDEGRPRLPGKSLVGDV